MPRGDKTGPDGQGQQSGRGQGPCGQKSQPVHPQAYGAGYTVRRTFELDVLRADADAMQKSLKSVQRRIDELEKEGSE